MSKREREGRAAYPEECWIQEREREMDWLVGQREGLCVRETGRLFIQEGEQHLSEESLERSAIVVGYSRLMKFY